MIVVTPRYGILGTAVVVAALMALVRGLFTPWLLCRYLSHSYPRFLSAILIRPVMTSIPVFVALRWLKRLGIAGATWPGLLVVAAATAFAYLLLAFGTCLEREHRGILAARLGRWLNSEARLGRS
jgi:hypothetical protein